MCDWLYALLIFFSINIIAKLWNRLFTSEIRFSKLSKHRNNRNSITYSLESITILPRFFWCFIAVAVEVANKLNLTRKSNKQKSNKLISEWKIRYFGKFRYPWKMSRMSSSQTFRNFKVLLIVRRKGKGNWFVSDIDYWPFNIVGCAAATVQTMCLQISNNYPTKHDRLDIVLVCVLKVKAL